MIRAYHLILSVYGFWLPNDPRGSWSNFVRSWELLYYGEAHKPGTTRSVAHAIHDRELREHAKHALKYPPVEFDGLQARAVARGFATAAAEATYRVHACAIMSGHAHLIIARHCAGRQIEDIAKHLKAKASMQLHDEGVHPLAAFPQKRHGSPHTPWARKEWKRFLETHADVERTALYVEQNPPKEGKRPQCWHFVEPLWR